MLDTASSRTIVSDKNCISCNYVTNFFDPLKSQTFFDLGQRIQVDFQSNKYIIGNLSAETSSFGTAAVYRSRYQYFLLVDIDQNVTFAGDGFFGLGFNILSNGTATYIETLVSEDIIKEPVFSLFLNNENIEYQPDSMMILGGYDKAYEDGDYSYLELADSRGYWEVSITSMTFRDTIYETLGTAIFDSKSGVILGPQTQVVPILTQFELIFGCSGTYMTCNCSGEFVYPELTIVLGNNVYSVSSKSYFKYLPNGQCLLLLSSHNEEGWILGQPFLREYYTVYDMENLQIFLAPAAKSSKSSSDKESRMWLVAVVVIMAIILIISIGIVSLCLYKKRNRSKRIEYNSVAFESIHQTPILSSYL